MHKITTKGHQVYMHGNDGPFKCENCKYYVGANSCNEEHIIALAKEGKFGLQRNQDLTARVDPDGFSDYFKTKR